MVVDWGESSVGGSTDRLILHQCFGEGEGLLSSSPSLPVFWQGKGLVLAVTMEACFGEPWMM